MAKKKITSEELSSDQTVYVPEMARLALTKEKAKSKVKNFEKEWEFVTTITVFPTDNELRTQGINPSDRSKYPGSVDVFKRKGVTGAVITYFCFNQKGDDIFLFNNLEVIRYASVENEMPVTELIKKKAEGEHPLVEELKKDIEEEALYNDEDFS